MLQLFRALSDRLKALFAVDVGFDFEAQLLTRQAERKAELLRQASRYEDEGLDGIAQHLRRRAETLDLNQPLVSVEPATEHFLNDSDDRANILALPSAKDTESPDHLSSPVTLPFPKPKKRRGGKS